MVSVSLVLFPLFLFKDFPLFFGVGFALESGGFWLFFFLFTEERYIAFIDHREVQNRPRVGETVEIRVTYLREDGRLNASLRPPKKAARIEDADRLLALLMEHDGKMPYTDATSPEVIQDRFHISKAAFKRALGRLLKDGLIEQRDGWTYLSEENKKS